MKSLKLVMMGLFLSTGLNAVSTLSSDGVAFAKPPHKMHKDGKHKDKGPCAEIECEKGDKFCHGKKKECKAKMFQKKLDEAKKSGITAADKAEWVGRLEKKITHKKERIADSQEYLKDLEARLKEVQALKAK